MPGNTLWVAMEDALLAIENPGSSEAAIDEARSHRDPRGAPLRALAADRTRPGRTYLGTAGAGLLRSRDGGRSWARANEGLPHATVTAVALDPRDDAGRTRGTVYVGTEPSTVQCSDDGGASWRELPGLEQLPSASTWSFPPRPETHHVRGIAPDPHVPNRLFVAIEAGALVRSDDGGRTWRDRVPGGPLDTHTLVVHPRTPGRLCAAAGDGYFESHDGGETWSRPEAGLEHGYLWDCCVHPRHPDTVVVSAARDARAAHDAEHAESWIYRRVGDHPWEAVRAGLPEPEGTTVSSLAADPDDAATLYAANGRGVWRSRDVGASWEPLALEWPHRFRTQRAVGLALAPAGPTATGTP